MSTLVKSRLSVKAQTIATFSAIFGAVALPQFLHIIGAMSGTGTSLGEIFLPMHLPVILVGFLAGSYAGLAAGILSPIISFALTGMPTSVMLPFIIIELAAYGFFAGMLKDVKMPDIAKVLTVQIAGRLIRALAIVFAVYALGNENIKLPIIWNSIYTGAFGIVLQLSIVPFIMSRTKSKE